jgi:hypothetical protein
VKSLRRAIADFLARLWLRLFDYLQRHSIFGFIAILLAFIAISALVLHDIESGNGNPVWRSAIYVLSGLDTDPPDTVAGKVVTILVLFGGVLVLSAMTGFIASEFNRVLLVSRSVSRKRRRQVFEDHVVIFGWGPKTKAILREIDPKYSDNPFRADDVVVVSEDDHLDRPHTSALQHVYHVRGAPTDPDTLLTADLPPLRGKGAKVAVILADGNLPSDEADHRSLLTLLAVEQHYPQVMSLTEVMREGNQLHFENAYADEVLVPYRYGTHLLARTSEFPGIASFVEELLALAPVEENPEGPTENPVSFYVRTAAELGVAGKTLADAIIDYYPKLRTSEDPPSIFLAFRTGRRRFPRVLA